MSVNDATKPAFGWLNSPSVGSLETKLENNYVHNDDLNTKVGAQNYIKIGAVNTALESYYTKTASDAKYAVPADIPDISGLASSSDVNTALALKADASTVYTKTESDAKYAVPADIPDVSGKLNVSDLEVSIDGLNKYATSSSVSTSLSSKLDTTALETSIDALSKYAEISSLSGKLNTADLEANIDGLNKYATSSSVSSGLSGKADNSKVNDIRTALVTMLTDLAAGASPELASVYNTAKASLIAA